LQFDINILFIVLVACAPSGTDFIVSLATVIWLIEQIWEEFCCMMSEITMTSDCAEKLSVYFPRPFSVYHGKN